MSEIHQAPRPWERYGSSRVYFFYFEFIFIRYKYNELESFLIMKMAYRLRNTIFCLVEIITYRGDDINKICSFVF